MNFIFNFFWTNCRPYWEPRRWKNADAFLSTMSTIYCLRAPSNQGIIVPYKISCAFEFHNALHFCRFIGLAHWIAGNLLWSRNEFFVVLRFHDKEKKVEEIRGPLRVVRCEGLQTNVFLFFLHDLLACTLSRQRARIGGLSLSWLYSLTVDCFSQLHRLCIETEAPRELNNCTIYTGCAPQPITMHETA